LAKAEKAEKFLERPELTSLLASQAAEVSGDQKKAEEIYRKMITNDQTRFVGVRGLMKQKLDQGDTDKAFKLAEKAFALKPKHAETQDILLQMQAQRSDWKGARQTLGAKLKSGSLPRDVYRRREAVLALSEAKDILQDDLTIEAREAAIEANKLSPDLVPAAVMAAQAYIEKGQKKPASRLLTKAWGVQPHPELAAAFAAVEPGETPQARIKRFNVLTRQNVEDAETRMLKTELLIAAEDFPEAARALGDLAETDPTTRSVSLKAAVERGQGAEDSMVRGWLARAVTAPRGPQWICDNCQSVQAAWQPVCDNCEAFDTLSWKRPPEAPISMAGGAELLPLLVGKMDTEETAEYDAPAPIEVQAETVSDATDPQPESTKDGEFVVNGTEKTDQPEIRH
jgi:HemY protein